MSTRWYRLIGTDICKCVFCGKHWIMRHGIKKWHRCYKTINGTRILFR